MAPRGKKRKLEEDGEKEKGKANGKAKVETPAGDRIVIEHCYGRAANELKSAVLSSFPEMNFEMNPTKPRRGSFEVALHREGAKSVEIWTGIKKGPPRKLKFPDPQEIVSSVEKALQ
ncbi:PREDICTED: selenoprotein H [Nanorana parkeri]|uniref:selenoprotein H n=1 Tax=Nanorana parkeri TaxID=125878 RepID=UPI0008547A6B|nr:PREDICTED: selenoprotein H [Nanorana parkeri]